jgi:hypothetical protein
MAYCTVADVEKAMQRKFSHNSGFPRYDDVQEYIDGVAANLNGILQAMGYTVPVTATDAVALLKRYNTFGAACQAYHAGYRTEDILPPHAEYWCNQYSEFIARLEEGAQQLPGLTPEGPDDPVFEIVQSPPRDRYFTGQDEPLE